MEEQGSASFLFPPHCPLRAIPTTQPLVTQKASRCVEERGSSSLIGSVLKPGRVFHEPVEPVPVK